MLLFLRYVKNYMIKIIKTLMHLYQTWQACHGEEEDAALQSLKVAVMTKCEIRKYYALFCLIYQ